MPGDLRVGLIHKDWPVFIPVGGRTSYLGDVLAIVVAEDGRPARAAAKLVEVEIRRARPVADPAGRRRRARGCVWGLDGNVLSVSGTSAATSTPRLAASAHAVHEVFQTQRIEHAFLEPESTLAVPEPTAACTSGRAGRGCGTTATRSPPCSTSTRRRVTVELVSNGGAFGGKEDMSNQAQTALAACLLERPVKCTLTAEESLLMHPKRHPIRMEYGRGATPTAASPRCGRGWSVTRARTPRWA